MNNGWGEMTKGTQRYRWISDKSDRLATKWTVCGLFRDHAVKTGLAKFVWDVVWFVQGDEGVGVLEENTSLLKAEMELSGGLEGGTLMRHRGSEEAFIF